MDYKTLRVNEIVFSDGTTRSSASGGGGLGLPGPSGASGQPTVGPSGNPGGVGPPATGPSGPSGIQGVPGANVTGPSGAPGEAGGSGPTGVQGPSGASGPSGGQGGIGNRGIAGALGGSAWDHGNVALVGPLTNVSTNLGNINMGTFTELTKAQTRRGNYGTVELLGLVNLPYTGSTTSASQGLTIALNGFPSVASQCIGIASLVTPTAPFTTYYFRVSASGLVVSLIPGYMPFYPTMPITNGLTYGLTVDCAYIFDSGTSLPFGTTVYEKIETTNGTTPVNVPIISFAQSSIRWVESLGSNKTCRLYSELTVSDSNQTSPWNTIRLTFSPGWLFLNNITVPTNVTGKLLYCRTGQNPVMMGSYNEGVVNTASFRANSNFVASSVDAVLVSIIDFTFT